MENDKKIIRHLRKVFLFLLIVDVGIAAALHYLSGSPFGWIDFSLNEKSEITLGRILAVLQFVVMAATVDSLVRRASMIHNIESTETRIPNLMILVFSIAIYGFFGLTGFVLLYDYSLKTLIAGSGAIGLGVAYMAKDFISEAIASLQIQYDRTFSIGDWIQIGEDEIYKVTDVDRRFVTLINYDGINIKFPSTKFLSGGIKNFSREATGCPRMMFIEIDVKHPHEKVVGILEVALKHAAKHTKTLFDRYNVLVTDIGVGTVTYRLKYFCAPEMAPTISNSLVLRTVLKFLNVASINLESSISVSRQNDVVDQARRLLDIRNQSVLKALSLEEIQTLARKVTLCEFRKDELILRHGDTGNSMFFIFEGSLDIQIPKENGEKSSVANLWPGDCVGEMSMLTGEPRSADVLALSDVVLLQVTKEDIEPVLSNNPELVEKLSHILAERKTHNEKHLSGAEAEAETALQTKTIAKRIVSFFALGLRKDI
jgi:CRP-like cAMP-binding protein